MARLKRILLVVGAAALALSCVLAIPCLQQVRDGEGWSSSAHRLHYIVEALRGYHESYGRLPPPVVRDKDGRPLYSWRVALLPFLEQDLYKRFRLDEPWDGPHNRELLAETLRCYVPVLGGKDGPGLTRYLAFVGPGTAFERDGLTWDDFPDDPANTILVVEAGTPVPWSKPVDLPYAPGQPLPPLGAGYTKPVHFLCYEVTRRAGFNAGFGDGSVRFLRADTDEATLRALITRNGGEKVRPPAAD
jgi:hypothetical protein